MVGLKCKDGVVFGVEKLTQSKLHKSTANSRVFTVDDHVGMVRMMSLPTWVLSCIGLLCLSIPDVSLGHCGANRLFQFHFVKVLCSSGPYLLPLLHCLHSANRRIFFFWSVIWQMKASNVEACDRTFHEKTVWCQSFYFFIFFVPFMFVA